MCFAHRNFGKFHSKTLGAICEIGSEFVRFGCFIMNFEQSFYI